MATLIEFETERLRLRQWRQADLEPFATLNADPVVMAYFPDLLTRAASDELAHRLCSEIDKRGWGFWAAEIKGSATFIGFVGLHVPAVVLPFSPCVEIGWRLATAHWEQGYATEAARSALCIGFDRLELEEIVSFTTIQNQRSRRVMERIGMRYDGEFEHPGLPKGHSLRLHALYRLQNQEVSA